MTFVYLVGGATYCERCKRYCSTRKKKSTLRKPKPAYLKYVRYHPTATVTPGWDGSDSPVVIPRIPAYWGVDGRPANFTRSYVAPAANIALPAKVSTVSVSRKRKAED